MKRIAELQNLNGRVALVTGGAGYLGRAICETLTELGANVIVASRNETSCKEFATELTNNFKTDNAGIFLDITDTNSLNDAFKHIRDRYGRLDVLINNAWSGNKNSFESITNNDWLYDINVCLNGPFYTIKAGFELLKETQGIILNVASMYGVIAPDYRLYDGNKYTNPPSYGAAKAGLIQLTKYLSSFLAPFKIRVNSISPGAFPFESTIKENPEFIDRLTNKTIIGRVGVPEDLKGVIAFLCTDASSYVTGQNISVDGGWTIW